MQNHSASDWKSNGTIIYQFSCREIERLDIEPFLQLFDYTRHRQKAVAIRCIGALGLAFDLSKYTGGSQKYLPSEIEVFRTFSKHLLEKFPALGLFIKPEFDTGFPHLVYANMNALRFHRAKDNFQFLEPQEFLRVSQKVVNDAGVLAEGLDLERADVTSLTLGLRRHLANAFTIWPGSADWTVDDSAAV
jgi:hypothetical protein